MGEMFPEADYAPLTLDTEFLCYAKVDVDAPISPMGIGETPWRRPVIAYIKGGAFEGPKLTGKVLPGGGDWPLTGNNENMTQNVDVRAVWETDDGARIYLTYGGRIALPPDVRADFATRGPAAIDPKRYYFRTTPTFETADDRYAWLNDVVTVAVGRMTATGIGYAIYRVL